ncbi:unnamed protein product, partial [marine sediment metagenome]
GDFFATEDAVRKDSPGEGTEFSEKWWSWHTIII